MRTTSEKINFSAFQTYLPIVWFILILSAYGRILIHPDLHTACPENDTWNLPIRWSVLSSLQHGHIPLWNSLSAFGIPWLATWQTECFYPGTLLFTCFGLSAWNFSGLLHLFIVSMGIYFFLRENGVKPFWAFLSSAIALINGCAYNHLGSNSSMDVMAWIPWMFLATRQCVERKPWGGALFALFLTLQVFAGYPQIIFYTLMGCFGYAIFLTGWKASIKLISPLATGLLFSAVQWIPSVEYFFINCVRHPAVHDNPNFFLPLKNLKTFLDFNALSRNGTPDYVVSPTYFYFNFYSGILPLLVLALGFIRFKRLKTGSRFFLAVFLVLILWSLGFFLEGLVYLQIPFPVFLEPAKCWVLINVFELFAVSLILEDLFPKPGRWKWAVLTLCVINLLIPVWVHPLERNLTPPNSSLEGEAQKIKSNLGSGRILVILHNPEERAKLYTPLAEPGLKPLFKHFIPNSNFFVFLPLATFYGSTQPTLGALDAGYYFEYVFPKDNGALMDLLGVDLLYLPQNRLPPHYKKIWSDGKWVLWKNPSSLGSHFFFFGQPQTADRKSIFTAFSNGAAKPLQTLFLDSTAVSHQPLSGSPPLYARQILLPGYEKSGFLIITQNAMPGWRAWLDGRPAVIYLADGIFQGLPFSPGKKEVRLSYEPASFRFGLFLSLLSLAGFLGWLGLRLSVGFHDERNVVGLKVL